MLTVKLTRTMSLIFHCICTLTGQTQLTDATNQLRWSRKLHQTCSVGKNQGKPPWETYNCISNVPSLELTMELSTHHGSEENVCLFQGACQHHGLLVVHVIVCCSVDQEKFLVSEILHLPFSSTIFTLFVCKHDLT